MPVRLVVGIGLALGALVAVPEAGAQPRQSLFPPEGCTPGSRINPCPQRALPAPVGDPTDGPLTEALRDGPLDPPKNPLGFDVPQPSPRPPLLAPARDRLGGGGKG